jgi:putative spermidine/putrescine transport system substrate-binding protein
VKARLLAITVAVLVFVPTALSATYAGGHVKKANAGTTIVIYASGDVNVQGLWQNNIIPGFEKANKGIYVKFIFSEHGTDDGTTLARIGAAVKGRHWPGIDLVDGGLVTTMALAGLNQPVGKATAPNIKKVNADLLVPVKGAAIPYRGSSVVLAYNSDKVKSPPKTLSALLDWIRANPGKFTYNSPNSGGSGYSFAETVVDSLLTPATRVTTRRSSRTGSRASTCCTASTSPCTATACTRTATRPCCSCSARVRSGSRRCGRTSL